VNLLTELVAEYPNLILENRIKGEYTALPSYIKMIFQNYGPTFLPELARMSLEDTADILPM